ncbi:MAG: hypothetical protein EBY22_10655, partial [Gammaproteobacteria bacterium]|nr:hypothetical protein [Gammaproteobacteria bacterium]
LVVLKENIGEGLWYLYTAMLIASIVYFNLANVGCKQSVAQIKASHDEYIKEQEAVNQKILGFRKQFYDIILKARELLDTVPDYFNQFETQPEHMEALNFNAKLGEEAKE